MKKFYLRFLNVYPQSKFNITFFVSSHHSMIIFVVMEREYIKIIEFFMSHIILIRLFSTYD